MKRFGWLNTSWPMPTTSLPALVLTMAAALHVRPVPGRWPAMLVRTWTNWVPSAVWSYQAAT
jgi:hypothetical protein